RLASFCARYVKVRSGRRPGSSRPLVAQWPQVLAPQLMGGKYMQRLLRTTVLLVMLAVGIAGAQDLIEINFQSKWFPQAQFAGYFVAQDKGFYAEEGLDVTILDGGNVNPTVQVGSGNADFGTDWVANMLAQREQGLDVVTIAQMYQASGY